MRVPPQSRGIVFFVAVAASCGGSDRGPALDAPSSSVDVWATGERELGETQTQLEPHAARLAAASATEPARDVGAATASEPNGGARVTDAYIARGVDRREPVGPGSEFPAAVGELWCLTRIRDLKMPARPGSDPWPRVVHVWERRRDDGWHEEARVPLTIKGRSWRTWSKKRIPPGRAGEWRVRIETESGETLAELPFRVLAAE